MFQDKEKIIIYKDQESELYHLVEKLSVTDYGVIKFSNQKVKEIKVKNGRPYQVITIEKSNLLSGDA